MSHQHCAPTEHNYQATTEPSPSGYWYLNTYTYRTMLYCTKCGHHFFVKQSVQNPITFTTTTHTNPAPAAPATVDWSRVQWSSFTVTNTLLCTNPQPSTKQPTFTCQRT